MPVSLFGDNIQIYKMCEDTKLNIVTIKSEPKFVKNVIFFT